MNRYTVCWCCNVWRANPAVRRARRRNYVRCKQKRMKQRRDVCGGKHRRFCVKGAPVVTRARWRCSYNPSAAQISVLSGWQISPSLQYNTFTLCFFFFLWSVCLSGEARGSSRQHAVIRMVRFCSGLRSNGEPSVPLLDLRLSGSANLSAPLHLPLPPPSLSPPPALKGFRFTMSVQKKSQNQTKERRELGGL